MLARHACGLSCASRLRLSLCVFDPVPGNLITTAKYLDLLGNVTTANRHIDLRSCRIVRCLALYPADPLPDIAFHAPLLPDYPKGCEVEEDATLGCHQACTMEATMQGLGQPTSHALRHYARVGAAHQACTVYCTHPVLRFELHGAPHRCVCGLHWAATMTRRRSTRSPRCVAHRMSAVPPGSAPPCTLRAYCRTLGCASRPRPYLLRRVGVLGALAALGTGALSDQVHRVHVLSVRMHQVRRFLLECGTRLRDAAPETWRGGDPLEAEALRLMEAEVCADAPSTRGAICRRGTAAVVRHGGRAEGRPRLLNRHHHRLLRARSPDDPRVCAAGAAPCEKRAGATSAEAADWPSLGNAWGS